MSEEVTLSWWAKIFRSKAKLTFWLKDEKFTAEVTDFEEVTPDCIVYRDYYSLKKTKVRYNCTIIYKLEELK